MRACCQRPSIAVGIGAVLVIGAFAWRGDLRIGSAGEAKELPRASSPVIVRRDPAPVTRPMSLRKGRVFDARGFLLVGAEIVPMQMAAVRSDGDGAFQFAAPVGRCVDVLVRSRGMLPRWLRSCDGDPDAMVVQLLPAAPWDPVPTPLRELRDLRGEGVVRDGGGRPLAGAFVAAVESGTWARTDELGRFVLPLPPGAVTLLVHDCGEALQVGGHAMRSAPFVSPRDQGSVPLPELTATAAATLRGTLRDARGVPTEGVPMLLRGEGLERVVATGVGGTFRIAGLLPGSYQLQPLAFRGGIGAVIDVTLAGAVTELDLQLEAADEVRVRVVDAAGAPLAGAYVASTIAGVRRGIAQTGATGFAAVPVARLTEFDVRTENLTPCSVQRFEPEPPTLVVTLP